MAIHRSLIAIIAKRNPAIWEEIIGPLGPMKRFAAVALNPQPLPPKAIARGIEASLNPQPLPPGVEYGFAVGAELVRAAGIAQLLRTGFDVVVDDICPPPRKWPPIPWPPAPWPPEPWDPRDEFDPEFVFGYAVGLAFALETSAHAWERLDGAGSLEQLHEAAFKTAEQFG